MNFAAGHSLLRAAPAARARRDYSRARNVLGRRGAHEFGARSKGLRCICRPSLSAFSTQAGPFLPSRGFQSPTATACATPSLRGRSFIRFPLRSLRGGSAVRSHIAGNAASLEASGSALDTICRPKNSRALRFSFASFTTRHAAKPSAVKVSRSSLSSMQISSAWREQCVIRVNWISRP